MTPDKPKPVPCVCKRFPFVAAGRKIRCMTKGCLFRGRKFESVEQWNEFMERKVVEASIKLGRELGILNDGI